jgi:hypothetical protein
MIVISSTGWDEIRYSSHFQTSRIFQEFPEIARLVGGERAPEGSEGCEGGIIKLSRSPSQLISILGGIIQVERFLF